MITKVSELAKKGLWSEKYAPKSLDDVIIHKNKITEFDRIMSDSNTKLIIMTGTPGSGKNSLIDTYCHSKGMEIVRYQDPNDSLYEDGYSDQVEKKDSYP